MSVVFFLIIKYLFFSNISCNNKGLFKLNNSIIKLENNENKINKDKSTSNIDEYWNEKNKKVYITIIRKLFRDYFSEKYFQYYLF